MDNIGTILGAALIIATLIGAWIRYGGSVSATPGMAGKVWKVIKWPLLVLVLLGLVRLGWYLWYNPQSGLNPIPTGAKITCTVTLPAEKFWEEQPFTCDGKKPEGKFRMDIQDVQLKILEGNGTPWGDIQSLKVSGAASPKRLFSRYRGSGTPTTRDWAFLIDGIPSGESVVITAGSKFSLNIDEDRLGWMKKLATKLDKPVQILVKLEQ